mgnify:CR=1 FL=1
MMSAQLVHIEDYRPLPTDPVDLWLDAWFQFWRGVLVLTTVPLALFIRKTP